MSRRDWDWWQTLGVPAPAGGEPDAADVVRDLRVAARHALDDRLLAASEGEHDPQATWQLLASWAAIRRLGEHWRSTVDAELRQQIDDEVAVIGAGGVEALHRLFSDLDVDGWLAEASDLKAAQEQGTLDAVDVARHARELLEELDGLELACWAAARLGCVPLQAQEAAVRCVEEVGADPSWWLEADSWVRAVVRAVDPDLDTCEPELATSLDKFEAVLIEVAAMHRTLSLQLEPLSEELVDELIAGLESRETVDDVRSADPGRVTLELIMKALAAALADIAARTLRPAVPLQRLAVAAGAVSRASPSLLLQWQADKEPTWAAFMRLPLSDPPAEDTVEVFFRELPAGTQWACLFGVVGALELTDGGRGRAVFSAAKIQLAAQDDSVPTLAVVECGGKVSFGVLDVARDEG